MKVALITGAGRGIGAATARLFAQHDYAVCINYRHNEQAAKAVQKTIVDAGGQAICIAADISQQDQVMAMFDRIDHELGCLSVLVNNAGILRTQCRFEDISVERFNAVLQTNLVGSFLCAQEAVKRMSMRHGGQGGCIINVSSGAAKSGSPNEYVDYAASKGALDTMTRGLALEVAGEGIRVNAVRPGFIYTDMHADGGEPDRVNRLKPSIPLQRGGSPEEVAEAILWLASPRSAYTTGSFIDLTGGV